MHTAVDRDNNFDAIRLVAAISVVVGHGWPLTGLSNPPQLGGIPIFTLAVFAFFSISGYLVNLSWKRDARVLPFLARRSSRIFPALAVVIAATTLFVGPLATSLTPWSYFTSPGTWAYLTNISLFATYELPGVFTNNPTQAVNGVLWSLGPEFLCYIGVIVVGLFAAGLCRKLPLARAAVFILIGAILAAASILPITYLDDARPALAAMVFFAFGAVLSELPTRRLPLWPCLLIVLFWSAGAVLLPDLQLVLAWFCLPYLVIAFGVRSTRLFRSAGHFGDFSYGVYLWGFPIQQMVWQAWPTLPLALNLAIVLVATLGLAFLSWHLIEKRALYFVRNRLQPIPVIPQGIETSSAEDSVDNRGAVEKPQISQ